MSYDINLIGSLNSSNSLSCHTTSFIDCLHSDSRLKFFNTRGSYPRSSVWYYQKLINKSVNLSSIQDLMRYSINQNFLSGITIYTDSCWKNQGAGNHWDTYQALHNKSIIKCAYVVAEYTKIPKNEVDIFNNYFDALIIPDEWLKDVYVSNGVKIPIFTLPLVLDLKPFLERSIPKKLTTSFVFGFSGIFSYRKNVKLLIKAFAQEFGDDFNVSLVLHSRFKKHVADVLKVVKATKCRNINVIQKNFTRQEYRDFISRLSSFVLLSKGEGFSIAPREALASGVPCILSNNTAHTSICKTGYVVSVASEIIVPAYLYTFKKGHKSIGSMFNCSISDVRKALRDMYQNYDHYYETAQQGREWTKRYLIENLQSRYISLVKPSHVILGSENKIEDNYVMVNSRILFDKYRELCADTGTVFIDEDKLSLEK